MYPVYLLEDDLQQQAIYQQIIANTIMINEFAMTLKCAASDTETLLAAIKDQQRGLFFLDMEIEDNRQAGLEVATKIRQMMPFAQIVFITTHEELTLLTLERKIAPLDYILKDQSMAEIKRQLIDDLLLAEKQNEAASVSPRKFI
ncbi:response regulator [Latilactobacillus sakei]